MNTPHAARRQRIGKWIRVAIVAGALAWIGGGSVAVRGQAQSGGPSDDNVWQVVGERPGAGVAARTDLAGAYAVVRFSKAAFDDRLGLAPREGDPGAALAGMVLTLPMPDGRFARFRVIESSILAPELAAAFPETRTYLGQGIDDPTATTRLGWTEVGFHAIILSASGTVYIDPYAKGDLEYYVSFNKGDYRKQGEGFICLVDAGRDETLLRAENTFPFSNGTSLRTYRLALAANGEYTVAAGGTKALALARMTTTMNRVNGIYERDLAVRMTMATGTAADPTALIYTDAATDPYTNSNGVLMLGQNQTTVDSVVGAANYDIGHVFSTGGGGVAYLRSPCNSDNKAGGVTGSSNPTGDAFDVDYVAHEMGHQFGGNHTFNGNAGNCGTRSANHAYEVGSGSTIQAYAGICSVEDLQPNSHDYFHVESLDEMTAFLTSGGGATCGTASATSNTLPTVSAGSDYTIPQSTPFMLTASGSDGNGDTLTYAWEEFDRGTVSNSVATASTDDGSRPLFRSYSPTTSPSRTFPSLTYILNNANVPPQTYSCSSGTCLTGEVLPSTNRTMTFQVTARDNRSGGGGIVTASMQATVTTSAGPFQVTSPNTAVSVAGGAAQTITWNVAGTTASPVSTANVKISLSTDGGTTFPTVLTASTANDGTENLTIPATATSTARIKVEAVGNVFFDISDTSFTITASSPSLAAPTLVSPIDNATVTTTLPTYSWGAVSGTEEYYLWVFNGGQQRIGQWYTAAQAGCSGGTGTCSVTPTTALANGTTQWEVKAWSQALGHGPWSADGFFTVASSTAATLTAPTLVSPIDNATVTTTLPTYSWGAVAGTEEYYLWVFNGGQQRIGQWYTAAQAGCSGGTGTCSVTPTTALASGTTRWEVKAWSQALGHGPWSADGFFTVASSTAATLTAPTLVSPIDNTTVTTTLPTYRWGAVSGTEEYYLWVFNGGQQRIGQWYTAAQAGCSGGTGTCSVTPATALASGTTRWEVKAWSQALGHGPWSADGFFTVASSTAATLTAPTLVSPIDNATVTTTQPTYRWGAVAGTEEYYLWVFNGGQQRIGQWYTAAQAGCSGGTGTCSVTPTTALASGTTRWEVKAWSQALGHGPWSADGYFTVASSTAATLTAPTLVSPIDNATVTTTLPTYSWGAVSGTEEYYLWVFNGGQQRIGQWYTAAQAGCSGGTGTCSVTPTTALASGTTRWEVKAWSQALGHGPWSADGWFTAPSASRPATVWLSFGTSKFD